MEGALENALTMSVVSKTDSTHVVAQLRQDNATLQKSVEEAERVMAATSNAQNLKVQHLEAQVSEERAQCALLKRQLAITTTVAKDFQQLRNTMTNALEEAEIHIKSEQETNAALKMELISCQGRLFASEQEMPMLHEKYEQLREMLAPTRPRVNTFGDKVERAFDHVGIGSIQSPLPNSCNIVNTPNSVASLPEVPTDYY